MLTLATLVIGVLAVLSLACGAQAAEGPADLVRSPDLGGGAGGALPAGWAAWGPAWEKARATVRATAGGILVEAPNEAYAVGGAEQFLGGVKGGQAYAVEAVAEARGIATPERSLLVRLTWLRGKEPVTPAGMLAKQMGGTGGLPTSEIAFKDIFVAPPDADGARLSLEVKWPEGGSVLWQRASVRPTAAPPARKVKVGAVYLRPKGTTPDENLELFAAKVDEAGKLGLDIVCLGESIRLVGTGTTMAEVAEPNPGPSTERLGAAARKNRLWVIAGLTERDGGRLYNTAVLLDREGRLAGKYRKIHLPREEWLQGVVPGGEYPVFKTDFGTIAIQICYDWFFPEPASIFALRGAEILFAPTWGDTLADPDDGRAFGETTFRTRAKDNGLYLVPSVYDGQSMVIDPMGRIVAANKGKEGVFWAEIDLAARELYPWVGWWRSIGPRDRMPETYGGMTERK